MYLGCTARDFLSVFEKINDSVEEKEVRAYIKEDNSLDGGFLTTVGMKKRSYAHCSKAPMRAARASASP